MLEMNNETIKIIKSKVPLYQNTAYFKLFKDILIDCTMKYLKKDNFNKSKNNNINKNHLGNIPINNYEKTSIWINVMKNIYIEKEIKNYNLKKDFKVNRQYSLTQKEKKEDNYSYIFLENKKNKYKTNNLVYLYLAYLSKIKLQKLNFISQKEKESLINIVRIYLGLCAQHIGLLSFQTKKLKNGKNNENFVKKKILKKLTLEDDDLDKKENSSKIKQNIEPKFMIAMGNVNYISNLKKRLAIKYINKKNKENDKINIEKNSNVILNDNIVKEEEKVDKDNFSEDLNNEEFIKSLNILNKKNKNVSSKILYSSSFTRLFIGETDLESIKERYLSNIDAKKEEKMDKKIYKNKHYNSTEEYLRKFSNRIIQYQNSQLPLIEKNLDSIYTKFRKNQEIIDKYKRISNEEYILEEKENEEDDYNKEKSNIMPQYKKNEKNGIKLDVNVVIDDINKDYGYTSLTNREYDKNEISKTPESKKVINNNEKDINKNSKNRVNNSSFNKRGIKDIFKLNKNNTINTFKIKVRNNKNNILKIRNNNKIFPNIGEKVLLTERHNSSKKSHFKNIFEKKLYRNKDDYMNYKAFYFNRNLTSRGEKNLYNEFEYNKKYQKTKNYFTRNDFYF